MREFKVVEIELRLNDTPHIVVYLKIPYLNITGSPIVYVDNKWYEIDAMPLLHLDNKEMEIINKGISEWAQTLSD